jgi:uncharacterized membrane protein
LTKTDLNIPGTRVRSIDVLRGVVMVLMAIDHVRVYSGIPAGGQSYGVFFTRWVTNFCAPAFVFLAGSAIFLYGNRINSKSLLARYLITRGILLVVLELTLIRFFWTFNFHYSDFLLAGIIWMLGWCMVIMAALIWLQPKTVGIIGLAIVFLQQIFGLLPDILPKSMLTYAGYFWEFFYPTGLASVPGISILYVLVPWIGVMAAGYGFGLVFLKDSQIRRKLCLIIGLSAIALFLIIGSIIAVNHKPEAPFLFRLLGQKKYPASQLFLLMTLGPLILCIPFVENAKGWLFRMFAVFGKVPLFYYILHILIIHLGALLIDYLREGVVFPNWYDSAPFVEMESAHRWSLTLLYLEFVLVIALLYFVCSWYAKYKQNHPGKKWLRYL